ncbi:MAG: hypothetical protein FWG66_08015 [Spirochaetes bacterium]|nr:hypothetical protein [Spirochaetota bacterium]
MGYKDSVYGESSLYAFFKTAFVPALRPAFIKCVSSIVFNFFLRQWHLAFLGRLGRGVPVSDVDHPLDGKIPFAPSWVAVYMDFSNFWIRMAAFFLRRFGRLAHAPVADFLLSTGRLYAFAARTYRRNLSTTARPFYIARPRFFLIHLLDPHLMCIPSLHIMVAINSYASFAAIARALGQEENLARQIIEVRQGAMSISRSILFVKQHSVNCIAASLYAMHCFDPALFPEGEAEAFLAELFAPPPPPDKNLTIPADCKTHPSVSPDTELASDVQAEITGHILSLYRRFLAQRPAAGPWEEPLVSFMKPLRR